MPNQINSKWTAEKVALLTERWALGERTSDIAIRLGADFNRNMVIGKARRLKLPHSPHGKVEQGKATLARIANGGPKRLKRISHKPMWAPKEPPKIATTGPVSLLDATFGQCRSIVGHQGPIAMFCGANVVEGSSYCPPHYHLYFQPNRPRLRV